jgi:hypothetical protein
VWVAVGAAVLLLLIGALVFREQPPYEFLRDAEHVRSDIPVNAWPEVATDIYSTETAIDQVFEESRAELAPHGWEVSGTPANGPRQLYRGATFVTIYPRGDFAGEEHLYKRTVIVVSRPPGVADRFRAWLDRVTGR